MVETMGWLVGAYLVGAVPIGLVYSRFIKGQDLRQTGSGNIGATNVLRTFGWIPGITVLFLDLLKGALPVLAVLYLGPEPEYLNRSVLVALAGLLAVLGHVYPVYLWFSGGKGVATAAGVFLVLAPWALIAGVAVFLLVTVSTRYVSAGSLSAALLLPVLCWWTGGTINPGALIPLAGGLSILVLWTHRENIRRLFRGEELPFYGNSS